MHAHTWPSYSLSPAPIYHPLHFLNPLFSSKPFYIWILYSFTYWIYVNSPTDFLTLGACNQPKSTPPKNEDFLVWVIWTAHFKGQNHQNKTNIFQMVQIILLKTISWEKSNPEERGDVYNLWIKVVSHHHFLPKIRLKTCFPIFNE